jgi:hypothetical protein
MDTLYFILLCWTFGFCLFILLIHKAFIEEALVSKIAKDLGTTSAIIYGLIIGYIIYPFVLIYHIFKKSKGNYHV